MTENEKKAFAVVYDFFARWREVIIETDEQWTAFAEDVGRVGREHDVDRNPLLMNLMIGVIETFGEMYKNGLKPVPANYFGRDDL